MIVDFISHSLNIFIDKVSYMFAVCCNNGMILGFDFLNVYFCYSRLQKSYYLFAGCIPIHR